MPRLPTPGSDDNQWGDILNEYLGVEHNADGTQKPLDPTKIAGTALVNVGTGLIKTGSSLSVDVGNGSGQLALGSRVDQDRRITSGILGGVPPISGRVGFSTTLATNAGQSTRLLTVNRQAASNFQLVYPNWHLSNDTETPNSITVKAAIEYPSGTYHPVHFVGEDSTRAITIYPGQTVVSMPVGIDIPANTNYYVRTTVVPAGGGSYPVGGQIAWYSNGQPDQCKDNDATDYTTTNIGSPDVGNVSCYGAMAILGIPSGGNLHIPVAGALGDSFSQGVGDTSARVATGLDRGFISRALDGTNIGYMQFGVNGYRANNFTASLAAHKHRLELATGLTDIVISLGSNDLSTGDTVDNLKANLMAIWDFYAARGVKVWQCNIAPRTTSTDSWATTLNQTPVSAAFGLGGEGSGSSMTQINTWLASSPSASLTGVIDTASAVGTFEPSLGSGGTYVYKAGHTSDGIHPNSTGCAAAAAVIPVSSFG